MADQYKILGQRNPNSTTVMEEIYLCPERASTTYTISGGTATVVPSAADVNTQTLVTSVIVTNVTANTPTFSIALFPTVATIQATIGTPTDPIYWLFRLNPMAARETRVCSLGLTLSAGNSLYGIASAADEVTFTAMGIETT